MTKYTTSLGSSDRDSITLLGHDLARDMIGRVGFGELAFWLATQQRPTAAEVRVFEAVLVSLTDHGFTPTAIAARLTIYSAPDSLQGALAAGLLGGGSRFLGVTEDTARYLDRALESAGDATEWSESDWDAAAIVALQTLSGPRDKVPGLGHPIHKERDPRTPALIALVEAEGLRGPRLRLLEAIGRRHPDVIGVSLPVNAAGVAGAVLADLGLPIDLLRAFALLARTAGLIGHLAEERIAPIAPLVYREVDRNTEYVVPSD